MVLSIIRERGLHYPNIIYIFFFHLCGLYGLFYARDHMTIPIIVQIVLFWMISGIGVTGGYHRLWSHRSYRAKFPFRLILAILGTIANQGSIYHWAKDHRIHHKYSDTEYDPHDISRGFFYSHMGWLFVRKSKKAKEKMKMYDYSDLLNDPIVYYQKKYYLLLSTIFCFGLPTVYGIIKYNSAFIGFFYFGVLRWLLSSHATWCVNSVSHTFGYRPYNPDIKPSENLFTSVVAVGEGYHNYHHQFPSDYSASEHGFMNSWNPTTLFIDFGYLIGQVYDRKKYHQKNNCSQNALSFSKKSKSHKLGNFDFSEKISAVVLYQSN